MSADGNTKIQVTDIMFLVFLDTCRSRLGGGELADDYSETLDPEEKPNVWALCAATSRSKVALQGAVSTELSAFTHYLVSEECGLFEPNVPVRKAVEDACQKLRENAKDQNPIPMGLHSIPQDFCLLRKGAAATEYDVCLCYRRDRDEDLARFFHDKLVAAADRPRVFWPHGADSKSTSKIRG